MQNCLVNGTTHIDLHQAGSQLSVAVYSVLPFITMEQFLVDSVGGIQMSSTVEQRRTITEVLEAKQLFILLNLTENSQSSANAIDYSTTISTKFKTSLSMYL